MREEEEEEEKEEEEAFRIKREGNDAANINNCRKTGNKSWYTLVSRSKLMIVIIIGLCMKQSANQTTDNLLGVVISEGT